MSLARVLDVSTLHGCKHNYVKVQPSIIILCDYTCINHPFGTNIGLLEKAKTDVLSPPL